MAAKVQEDLTGRVVVVTGANAGIGKETARALAAMGAGVVMTARDRAKGDRAAADVRADTGNPHVVVGDLDLASLASVRRFADWFNGEFERLDVLVNNAGLILDERRTTDDGFEMTFGVNHLGHFLLTDLLLPRLLETAPSRIVTVSSVAHRFARRGIDRDDPQHERRYRPLAAYGQSKLANVLFTVELARRLDGTGVSANCLHPGNINSNLANDGDAGGLSWWIRTFGPYVLRSPQAGARTSVMLAASRHPAVASSNGGYWSHGRRWRPSRPAQRADAARWLWEESERLIAEAT